MTALIAKGSVMLGMIVSSLAITSAVFAATISGFVTTEGGKPVSGVELSARTPKGDVVCATLSDTKGGYTLSGLLAGTYYVDLKPITSGYQGQSVVANLPASGLCLDWTVSKTKPARAFASPAAGKVCKVAGVYPFGLDPWVYGGATVTVFGTGIGLCEWLCGATSESE